MGLNLLRTLALSLAFGAALIPFATYITFKNNGLLWILIGANAFAYIIVALTTIRITLEVARREKAKSYVPARWADNAIMSKWYSAVRLAWKWHGLAAIARMGLAVGIMQWFYFWDWYHPTRLSEINPLLLPFMYGRSLDPNLIHVLPMPQWETLTLAMSCLFAFALNENCLLVAVTILFNKNRKLFSALITRTGIFLVMIALLFASMDTAEYYRERRQCYGSCTTRWGIAEYHLNILRHIETGQIALISMLDNGVMLSTNLIRPINNCPDLDNRPFVVRNIVAGLLGLLIYAGITRLILRAAMQLHRRENVTVA